MPTTWNNIEIPAFIYGTAWKKEATTGLVQQAVQAGFKAIDTANQLKHYDEAKVGDALLALKQAGISRESLFLQTKFTSADGQDHRTPYDRSDDLTTQVRKSFQSSLGHLHTDVLDSYVLHGPYTRRGLSPADWEVWTAIEEIYKAGKTRIIGVSNVTAEQVALLCAKARTRPMVVQNRCYAVTGWDYETRAVCRANGILYQGFSLLTANQDILGADEIHAIAHRLGAGIAQVIFRFAQQIGMVPLTGTTNPEHMAHDLESERFTLTPEDLRTIESIAV